MKFIHGKLFQNIETGKVSAVTYDTSQDYYQLIREEQKRNFRQSIVTSDIMISIAEHFLISEKSFITAIDFLVDDDELKEEIDSLLKAMKKNPAYWAILKKRLEFLSKDDSVDIKKIEMQSANGLCSVCVNGVFSSTKEYYDNFSKVLSDIVEKFVA